MNSELGKHLEVSGGGVFKVVLPFGIQSSAGLPTDCLRRLKNDGVSCCGSPFSVCDNSDAVLRK